MSSPVYIAFDLYGTLLSTDSISKQLADIYGDDQAKTIATQARRYQLEYTWRCNSIGKYLPFDELTRLSFKQATAEIGTPIQTEDLIKVMEAYNGLQVFSASDEVTTALSTLKESPRFKPSIFSNGTKSMITSSVKTSPSLASCGIFSEANIISIDDIKVYKPDPRAYQHLLDSLGAKTAENVWLVSSNAFDIVGAALKGFNVAWVDRGGEGFDGLMEGVRVVPQVRSQSVRDAVEEIMKRTEG